MGFFVFLPYNKEILRISDMKQDNSRKEKWNIGNIARWIVAGRTRIIGLILVVGLLLCAGTYTVAAASGSRYETLTIDSSSLNGNTIWGATESYSSALLDAWGGFFSAARSTNGGLPVNGSLKVGNVPYQLANGSASKAYDGNDSIRLTTSSRSRTMYLDTYGSYEKIYVLGTAGGPGTGHYANFQVTLTYTDGTTKNTTYRLYDWYDTSSNSGVEKYLNVKRVTNTGSFDGSTAAGPLLQSATIDSDSSKLLKSITFTLAGIDGSASNLSSQSIYCGVYAVTGAVNGNAPAAPRITATTDIYGAGFTADWNAVSDASWYYLDISETPDFKTFVTGYNNKKISTTTEHVTNLKNGTKYYLRVRAANSSGASLSSNVAEVVTYVPNTAVVNLTLDEQDYEGQNVILKSAEKDYTLTGEHGCYSNEHVANGTYSIFVNGKDTGEQMTFAYRGSDMTKGDTVTADIAFDTISVMTRLNHADVANVGNVALVQNGQVVYSGENRDGSALLIVKVETDYDEYQIRVDGKDTGKSITVAPNASIVIDYYELQVAVTYDRLLQDANVLLRDGEGKLVDTLKYKSGNDSTAYYSGIMQEDEKETPDSYAVYVNGQDTHQYVSAVAGANEASVTFYQTTVYITLDDSVLDSQHVTMSNGKDHYDLTFSEGAYVNEYTLKNVMDGEELPYSGSIDSENYAGNFVVDSDNKIQALPYYTVRVTVKGNLTPQHVDLKADEENDTDNITEKSRTLSLKHVGGKVWSLAQQKSETEYTVYVDGLPSGLTQVRFNGNYGNLVCGLYETTVRTMLDGSLQEGLLDTCYMGEEALLCTGKGIYQFTAVTTQVDPVEERMLVVDGETDSSYALGSTIDLDYYSVQYDGGDSGVLAVPQDQNTYKKGKKVTLAEPGQMTNPGKIFTGWKIGDTLCQPGEQTDIENTLKPVAQWNCIPYTIHYDMNDQDADDTTADAVNAQDNPLSYTVEDRIEIKNPTRDKFLFDGWTYEGCETPVADLVLDPGSVVGNLTLTAHWSAYAYDITADPDQLDFGTRITGYKKAPQKQFVTITNAGNQPVVLETPTSDKAEEMDYIVEALTDTSLLPRQKAVFAVQPKDGLTEGEHTEKLRFVTDYGTEAVVNLQFFVGKDTTAPTGYIQLDDEQFRILNQNLTFDNPILYGTEKKVSIYAEDEETGVGAISYYLSDRELTSDELKALPEDAWKVYITEFTLTDNGRYALYARIADREVPQNVTYLATKAFEIDTLPPVIDGIQNGVYEGETGFTVTDANLASVTVDGVTVTPDDSGVYKLQTKKGAAQVVKATDRCGKETSVIVTVNPKQYHISYDANGGQGTMEVSTVYEGDKLILPEAAFIAPDGKEFAGWSADDSDSHGLAAGSEYIGTEDVTLYALWQNISYPVVYELDGGEFAEGVWVPEYYTVEDTVKLPKPQKRGYTFAGWSMENEDTLYQEVQIPVGSRGRRVFTAHWTEKTTTEYQVKYWLQNMDGIAGQYDEADYTLAETVTLSGDKGEVVMPEVKEYEGFTAPSAQSLTLNPALEQEINYYYSRDQYQLTFIGDEGIVSVLGGAQDILDEMYPYGKEIVTDVRTAPGYNFSGIYAADGSLVSLDPAMVFTMPASRVTYYVKADPINYKISYNLDGGVLAAANPESYQAGTTAFTLHNPTKEGFTFAGWIGSMAGENVTISKGTTGDLSFTATWIPLSEGPVDPDDPENPSTYGTYIVNHMMQNLDGTFSLIESQRYSAISGSTETPAVRSFTGFQSPDVQSVTVSSNDIREVTYQYSRNAYTLTLMSDKGISSAGASAGANGNADCADSNPVTLQILYGQQVSLHVDVQDGYTFAGWKILGGSAGTDKYENPGTVFYMPSSDVTLTAQAVERKYAINYNLAGGTLGTEKNPTYYMVNDAVIVLNNPVRAGYEFTGWSLNNETDLKTHVVIDPGSGAPTDLSFTAHWIPRSNIKYTVRYWKQLPNGDASYKNDSNYALVYEDNTCVGKTGELVTPVPKEYAGYITPDAITISIAEDGSTVVDYYYARKDFSVDLTETNVTDTEKLQDKIQEINELLTDQDLSVEDKQRLEEQKNALNQILNDLRTTDDIVGKLNKKLDDPAYNPSMSDITAADRADLEKLIQDIDSVLNPTPNYLSEDQKKELLQKRSELQEKINHLETIQNQYQEIQQNQDLVPDKDQVTADDRQSMEDTLHKIDELLSDISSGNGNLTPDQEQQLKEWKKTLEEGIKALDEVDKRKNNINDRNVMIDSKEYTSDDLDAIENLIHDIQDLLRDEDAHLTETEKQKLRDQLSGLIDKKNILDKLENDNEQIKQDYEALAPIEKITTSDKAALNDLLSKVQDLLEQNDGHLNRQEQEALEIKKKELEKLSRELDDIDKTISDISEKRQNLPDDDHITGNDRSTMEDILENIDRLLKDEKSHLTDSERKNLEKQRKEIRKKYEPLKKAKDQYEDTKENYDELPDTDHVTSNDRKAMEDMIKNLDKLLENPSQFTDEEVDRMREQKKDLQDKLNRLDHAKRALDEADDILKKNPTPSKDKVTSDDKEHIREILASVNDRLKDYEDNLTDLEKKELNALREKLNIIEEMEKELQDVQKSGESFKAKDNITSSDKDDLLNTIDQIDTILKDRKNHLTEAEKNYLTELRKTLAGMLDKLKQAEEQNNNKNNNNSADNSNNVNSADSRQPLLNTADRAAHRLSAGYRMDKTGGRYGALSGKNGPDGKQNKTDSDENADTAGDGSSELTADADNRGSVSENQTDVSDPAARADRADSNEQADQSSGACHYHWYILIVLIATVILLLLLPKKYWWTVPLTIVCNLILSILFCIFGDCIWDWILLVGDILVMTGFQIMDYRREKGNEDL